MGVGHSVRWQKRVIQDAAKRAGIRAGLLWGVYGAETDFGRNITTSGPGAAGPFQLMPENYRGAGLNPNDFKGTANWAARELARYGAKGGRDERSALIAYNAGPGYLHRALPGETTAYIPKVLKLAKTWGGSDGIAPGGNTGGRTGGGKPGGVKAPYMPDFQGSGLGDKFRALSALDASASNPYSAQIQGGGWDFLAQLADENDKQAEGSYNATKNVLARNTWQDAGDNQPVVDGATRSLGEGDVRILPSRSWGGSAGIARAGKIVAGKSGFRVSSAKRDRMNTASGNPSDHWVGSKQSYAYDFANGVNTEDRAKLKLAHDLAHLYHVPFQKNSYVSGTRRIRGGIYRFQILYGAGVDHADHVHLGIKRVG